MKLVEKMTIVLYFVQWFLKTICFCLVFLLFFVRKAVLSLYNTDFIFL